jgi:hypothetical protein
MPPEKARIDTFAFNYQVYRLQGGEIADVLALADHFDVAKAAYTAAKATTSNAVIQIRNGARVMRTARTGAYDTKTGQVALLEERD